MVQKVDGIRLAASFAETVSEPAEIYDLKGLNCPLPALKARKRLAGMQTGQCLWVETTDPLAAIDIPAFCDQEGHHLIETRQLSSGHRFLIQRG